MRSVIFFVLCAFAIVGCDSFADDTGAPVINVTVEAKVKAGELLYENIDATINVSGYNEAEKLEWSHDYSYTGGFVNILPIPANYHHYKFSMMKWGQTSDQTLTLLQLNEQRSDGYTPGVIVLGIDIPGKKLVKATFSTENLGASMPVLQTEYVYDESGHLVEMDQMNYNSELQTFVPDQYLELEYSNNRVAKLSRFNASEELTEVTNYTYTNTGDLSMMNQENILSGISSVAEITYNSDGMIQAVYTNSNGTGFAYFMNVENKNVASEQVRIEGSLCQQGNFTYDKNINPFKQLGFTDFTFTQYSYNNRLTESTTYNCSLPTLIPTSYSYQYDEQGYPTTCTVNYEGGLKGQYVFEYL